MNWPGIFIFTGSGGGAVGYKDAFQADGSLRYTGEGQVGDMVMAKGNRAIRDHAETDKDLLLFEQSKKGGLVRFLGLFACAGWDFERQPDINETQRDAIVFTLVPLRELDLEGDDLAGELAPSADLQTLRMSDGGPDDPSFVAGVCPNCHRRAHYGEDQSAFNEELRAKVRKRETAMSV